MRSSSYRTARQIIIRPWLAVALWAMMSTQLCAEDLAAWPGTVAGFSLPKPNEHPRLFFRKHDLPAIRRRAEEPEGQAIIARLKRLLGGGEAMPTTFSRATKAYADLKEDLPIGSYTLWHAAGFGMLFQLTGERKYADLGRQCVQLALDGQRDRDDRYAVVEPGGLLRAGPSIGAIAMAYDLCYDGWDPAFRVEIARRLQNYHFTAGPEGKDPTVDRMARKPKHKPGSNHFGCQVGGAGLVLLAIRGDDGVDNQRVEKLLPELEKNIVLSLTEGFGDGGYFWEHPGAGQIASDTALVPMLQAMKVAAGKDYITPRPNAQWISLRWMMELIPSRDGRPFYPNRHPSSYGTEYFERFGLSRGGQFAQGFGAVEDRYKPGMLWVYEKFVQPSEPKLAIPDSKDVFPDTLLKPGEKSFDAVLYPHRAVLALVNWPIDTKPQNPAEVLPRAMRDSIHQYYAFRNRWQDSDDIIVTALLGARDDGVEPIIIWGLGMRTSFPVRLSRSKADYFQSFADGSGVVAVPTGRDQHYSFAVDFSGKSGAPLLVVMAGGVAGKSETRQGPDGASVVTSTVSAGNTVFTLLTLQRGAAPVAEAVGDSVRIGRQRLRFDGRRLIFSE